MSRPAGRPWCSCATSTASTRAMVEEARAIRENLVAMRVPFLINDRVDVALAADADGVHVGQDDMAVEDARRLLGPGAIIGLSIKTVEQAEAAPIDLLDYAAIGGVYVTTSKDNPDPPVGVDGPGAHRAGAAPAPPGAADLRDRGHRCIERGGDHPGRCRRRRGDLRTLARREPARRRARAARDRRRRARRADQSMMRTSLHRRAICCRPRAGGDPACSSVLGTNQAAVVPAQAGTHSHRRFGYRWPCHVALLRRMGPRRRGDDGGESLPHIFASGDDRRRVHAKPSSAQ